VQTQPWRLDRNAHSGADPAGFDRESRLLYAFLICCNELVQPRSRMLKAAKPDSAFKMIDGVRSCHRCAGIFMVSTKQPTTVIKGIKAKHIKEHGPESLLSDRKDPIGPTLCRQTQSRWKSLCGGRFHVFTAVNGTCATIPCGGPLFRVSTDITGTRGTIGVFHPAPFGIVDILDTFDIRDRTT